MVLWHVEYASQVDGCGGQGENMKPMMAKDFEWVRGRQCLTDGERARIALALREREELIDARELLRGQRWPQEFHDFIEKYYSPNDPAYKMTIRLEIASQQMVGLDEGNRQLDAQLALDRADALIEAYNDSQPE